MAIAPRTIFLKGDPDFKERKAGGTITPGQLIQLQSDDSVVVHSTARGNQAGQFAIENALRGKTIDDNYSSGERCQYICADAGDEVFARLTLNQTVVEGDILESHGDGDLQKHVAEKANSAGVLPAGHQFYPKGLVAIALEAVTTTSAVKRIKVQVL